MGWIANGAKNRQSSPWSMDSPRRPLVAFLGQTQKRPETEPQGVPEFLDQTVRQQIKFWEIDFFTYETQKRPNTEPQGVPEFLDQTVRQQIKFQEIDLFIYETQKRPNTEPQGVPEFLDWTVRQQIQFWEIDFLHMRHKNGPIPSHKASHNFSIRPFDSKLNSRKSILQMRPHL